MEYFLLVIHFLGFIGYVIASINPECVPKFFQHIMYGLLSLLSLVSFLKIILKL